MTILPSGKTSRIKRIETIDGEIEAASPPLSVSILLEDDIDISRGDMICRPHNQPTVANELEAMMCWMADAPLRKDGRYFLKHTTRTVRAVVDDLRYRIDVNTLHRDQAADGLGLNEIGRVRLRTSAPLLLDSYDLSRTTGGFVLIDETTQDTVGAGMVISAGPEQQYVPLGDAMEARAKTTQRSPPPRNIAPRWRRGATCSAKALAPARLLRWTTTATSGRTSPTTGTGAMRSRPRRRARWPTRKRSASPRVSRPARSSRTGPPEPRRDPFPRHPATRAAGNPPSQRRWPEPRPTMSPTTPCRVARADGEEDLLVGVRVRGAGWQPS